MAKEGRHKNRRPSSVPVAADSGPTRHPTSKQSGADDPEGKNSTFNPNIESLVWVTYNQEERLDKFIKKKLDHLYGQALSRLVYMGYDEDVALQGLLARGYCVGVADDCLTNIVQNSLEFLTGKHVESEQDRSEPFKNLELLLDFNLHFLKFTLQKYGLNLNRMSLLRCILMNDLNLNRAIMMNMPFDVKDMPSDSNLEYDDIDDEEKDVFLVLEIGELFDKLNILDDSVTTEDMKDKMIADLKKPIDDLLLQLEKRIRWARKKVAEAIRKQPCMTIGLKVELRVFEYCLEFMLKKREFELLSANNGLDNAEETKKHLEMVKEEIKAEISASKLIESETKQKCLNVSKKERSMNLESQKMEMELEKKKVSKWKQELVEIEAAIIQAKVKLGEATKTKQRMARIICMENQQASEKWDSCRQKVDALKNHREIDILNEQMDKLKKLLGDALSLSVFELQDQGSREL